MSSFDVRKHTESPITELVFADAVPETAIAVTVRQGTSRVAGIEIVDEFSEFVVVKDADHARDLVKALNKAIAMGWLK